jgi:corrinoid protein of di/trimethylamine methyltransferase
MRMANKELFSDLRKCVLEGDQLKAKELTKAALAQGVSAREVLEQGLIQAMMIVGDKWKSMEIFLPEVLMAVEAWKGSMSLLEPLLSAEEKASTIKGKVVIGSVKGDIHEIGKNIVAILLKTAGFEVIDIGTDVPASVFVSEAEKSGAKIIAASALMTTTMPNQIDIIKHLESKGIRDEYFVMVGGGPVNQEWANKIGANGYGKSADDAVRLAIQSSGK